MTSEDNPWTYTFADLRTDAELAVLPLTGVDFDRGISRVGALSGYLSLLDAEVRDQDPWAATTPRRTALYVERDNPETGSPEVRWAGMVWGRKRSAGSYGLTLTCATFESFLAHQLLRANLTQTQRTAVQGIAAAVAAVQGYPGGNIGLTVIDATTGAKALRDRYWTVESLRSVLDLITNYTETQTPIEFRVDVTRAGQGWAKRLLVGEPRLGTSYAASGLELAYPDGALLDWSDDEDGSAQDNTLVAVGGTGDTGGIEVPPPYVVLRDTDVGSDEVAAGFPVLMRGLTATDETTVQGLTDTGTGDLLSGMAVDSVFSGLKIRTDRWPFGSWLPADDVNLSISHPAYREWPEPMERVVRILAEKVTPATGTSPDAVELTVGADALGHLPASVTLNSRLRQILNRLTRLETR
jgi:hypothetical protein